ncbi:MAG: phage tail sheath C-terminal domain-containing protein [Cyanobacteria bacterium J06560_6]
MALDYFAPGVYIEEVDRGSRPIEGISMSVAGFIGFTEDIRGDAELFKPMLITSWEQYLQYFGKPRSEHPGFTKFGAYLPFSIRGWFDNGGGRCWVVSIGTLEPGATPPSREKTATRLLSSSGKPVLQFNLKEQSALSLLSEGDQLPESDRIRIIIDDGVPKGYDPDNPNSPFNTGEYFTVKVQCGNKTLGLYEHLTMDPDADPEVANYVVTALQTEEAPAELLQRIEATDNPEERVQLEEYLPNAFKYLDIAIVGNGHPLSRRPKNGLYEVVPPPRIGAIQTVSNELQGSRDKGSGIEGLFEIDEVSMVACPDLMMAFQRGWLSLDQVHLLMERMLSLCETSFPGPPYRMAVLDAPPVKVGNNGDYRTIRPEEYKPQHVEKWLKTFNRRSMFGALYYPWIKVANPADGGRPALVPPCGHMMGLWCRTDQARGIFKAPANDTPRGVVGLAYDTNTREQELLNPKGINCIRNFDNFDRGYKVWGARTLVEPDNIQWRYISVRRLCSYIEKSIERGTQWVVFEPNDSDLWARVTRTVTGFLTGLWRDGALFGASPNEAFYVKCDADNNPHESMMKGRLHIDVGVSPVRPAEFVIFRISQWDPTQDQN